MIDKPLVSGYLTKNPAEESIFQLATNLTQLPGKAFFS
jgi:hypothetical protein